MINELHDIYMIEWSIWTSRDHNRLQRLIKIKQQASMAKNNKQH